MGYNTTSTMVTSNSKQVHPEIAIFTNEEIATAEKLTIQEYLSSTIHNKYRYLPRVSIRMGDKAETTTERQYLDLNDPNKWTISKSKGILTARGTIETYDILEKLNPIKRGKIVLSLNTPFIAYLDSLPAGKLQNLNVLIVNAGITQEVIDENNQIIKNKGVIENLITNPDDALMSVKNKSLLEERGANVLYWDFKNNGKNPPRKFELFLVDKNIGGIIINGGSIPATAPWIYENLAVLQQYLYQNPDSWCAMLCAPIYVLNSGPLLPVYQADIYKIPKQHIRTGMGFFGSDTGVQAHFKSRKSLGGLGQFYRENNPILVEIPDKGIFIY